MSNFLTSLQTQNYLEPVFPQPLKEYSLEETYTDSIPTLLVKTDTLIKKKDSLLTVGKDLYNISDKTIKDVCTILNNDGIEVTVVGDIEKLELPALLLTDVLSEEILNTIVTVSPLDLERLSQTNKKGLIAIESITTPLTCIDTSTSKSVLTSFENNKVYFKEGSLKDIELIYNIKFTKFLWNISEKTLVTNSKSFISKYMEK